MTALGFERGVGRRSFVQYLTRLEQLRRVVSVAGVRLEPAVEREFGEVLAKVLMYRDYTARVAAESMPEAATDTSAYNKLIWSELQVQAVRARGTGSPRGRAAPEQRHAR